MLKETKITLSVAAVGGNSALGIYFNEFLRLYLFMTGDSDELSTLDSDTFKSIMPTRKRVETVTYTNGSKSSIDPRKSKTTPSEKISSSTFKSHTPWQMGHISNHKDKLVNGREEEAWWKSIYDQRIYIMKNQDINIEGIEFAYGFSATYIPSLNSRAIYMNQFCHFIYGNSRQYNRYKDLFWLICSINGKNPEEQEENKRISETEQATFPTPGETTNKKTITYMTLSQAKKKESDIKNIKVSEKEKYIVYDYSEEWWKWSYQYRFQKDQADESSAYPLSEQFKKVEKDWDDKLNNQSLNKVCKDFYEKSSISADEQEDALRYCSAEGK
ncbi:hypothetical protein [Candidatus Mycoplasma haematohominis]|uniref:Uncharacterized protein n=1 Tax=Candidatus Mycoplasma haematohominis TaxID=1494318 RepID=A0A478FQJ1_9MOLU|nr:hypothetical protein [Candidatus Mycoplasma haemohominis]GCE63612.1 hypothetical protein MHSWG343_06090 [Candidatus Mycoplasma haemohominis]